MIEPAQALSSLTGLSASLRSVMPEALRFDIVGGVEAWQVLGGVVLVFLLWLLAVAVVAGAAAIARGLSRRTRSTLDDELIAQLIGPARLLVAALLAQPATTLLGLSARTDAALDSAGRAVAMLAFFWALLRAASIAMTHAAASSWAQSRPGAKSLIVLGRSVARATVFAVGVLSVLTELHYPVASILAGLGLGGLALALAAQKTVEHLFGAFSLAVDQPFRVGDFVRVEDFVGTVETIGLRSTRFRTLDRTLITIPNGKLADARLETFAARDRIRLACTLGLVYQTTAAQMRAVLEGLEATLRGHPKIWPDAVVVKFKELGASSLDVEVMAWFQTSDWGEFQQLRQDVLLDFMQVVERAGSSFAFPTRTVHLVNEASAPTVGARPGAAAGAAPAPSAGD